MSCLDIDKGKTVTTKRLVFLDELFSDPWIIKKQLMEFHFILVFQRINDRVVTLLELRTTYDLTQLSKANILSTLFIYK